MMFFRVIFILFAASRGLCSMIIAFPGYLHIYVIWASAWQTYKMACAPSKDSDHPGHPPSLIRFFAVRSVGSWGPKLFHADSEDSDQTGRVPMLIWVFGGRTCHFVDFVMRWLVYDKRCIILKGKTIESNKNTQKLEWRHFVGRTS